MSNEKNNGLQYFVIIAEQKKKDKLLSLLGEHEAYFVETVYAHGSVAKKSAFASAFGFEIEQHKVLITCLLKNDDAKEVLKLLYNDYNFNKPNTGIAYSISVEGLAI